MTGDDVYVVVCFGAVVLLIGVSVGFVVDHWAGWVDARRRFRADRDAIRYCRLPAAHFGPCVPERWSDPSPSPRREGR